MQVPMMHERNIPPIARPALVAGLYLILYFDMITGFFSPAAGTESWLIATIIKNSLRIGELCGVMAWMGGFKAFFQPGTGLIPTAKDILNALGIAAVVGLCSAASSMLLVPNAWTNPLVSSLPKAPANGRFIMLVLASSLGTGYSEELFFRFFVIKNFELSGFSTASSILISAVIFGLSHQAQGVPGMLIAGFSALLFSFALLKGKSLHALAIGHALYDAGMLLLLTT